ncbi:MAG: VOC family protein [Gemmatimonas sp.]
MPSIKHLSACLWFDAQGEDAANFYVSIFDNSKIISISRYTDEGFEFHRRPAGSVMTVEFELDGNRFTALNGGPDFKFSEAISFEINCETQEDIDYFWEKLSEGGDPNAQQCGWLKDKFGLSWQVVPAIMWEMQQDPDKRKVDRMLRAMFQMKKLDIAELQRAFDGD